MEEDGFLWSEKELWKGALSRERLRVREEEDGHQHRAHGSGTVLDRSQTGTDSLFVDTRVIQSGLDACYSL